METANVMKQAPEVFRAALSDLQSGKMTQEEYQYLCVNYAYNKHLRDYTYTMPPTYPYNLKSLEETKEPTYDQLSLAKYLKREYLEQKEEVETRNNANFWWLCEMRKMFEAKGETEKVDKVVVLIRDYQQLGFGEFKKRAERTL